MKGGFVSNPRRVEMCGIRNLVFKVTHWPRRAQCNMKQLSGLTNGRKKKRRK